MVNNHSRRNKTSRSGRIAPGITLVVQKVRSHHLIDEFLRPEFGEELLQQLQDADNVDVELHGLVDWPDAPRFLALQCLAGLSVRSFRTGRRGPSHTTLLDAVLDELVGDADVARCERGKRAALEVVALCHADAIEMACSKVSRRMKDIGVRGVLPQSLVKCAKQLVLANAPATSATPQALADRYLAERDAAAGIQEGTSLLYYQQSFYDWGGTTWLELKDDQIESRVTRWLQRERSAVDAAPINGSLVRDIVLNLRAVVAIDSHPRGLPLWVESLPSVMPSNDIAFRNGRVDRGQLISDVALHEVEVGAVDPRLFSTVVLPFDFDGRAQCPLWLQTIQGIFPQRSDDDHRIQVLQEFMGLTLAPGDMSFQKFLTLQGRGNNGKSLILHIWREMLGPANVSHVPLEQLNGEFRQAEMIHKLANIAPDMNYIDKVAEGHLKALTSGDPVQVNRKFKSPMTMVPTAKLIFGTNELPRFNDRSDGVWRRLIAMPFHRVFRPGQDEDRNRKSLLMPELPGIVNWAVEGARRLYQQGGFTACGECERCKNAHRLHSDPGLQWWESRGTADPHAAVRCDDAYADYQAFCETNGYKAKNSSEFGKELIPRLRPCSGSPKRRLGNSSNRIYYYCGMRLHGGADQNFELPQSECRCCPASNQRPRSQRSVGRT